MIAVGLFSGVGGIELGLEQAGINTIWSLEIDKNAIQTFSLNHKGSIICKDIHKISSNDVPLTTLVHAGFPCQAFSVAGYRKGFEDERGNVFFQLARVIRDIKPDVILIENVKNIVGHDYGNTYRVITETLTNYGYHLKHKVLNATEYGNIPQNRERVYIIGFLSKKHYDHFEFPEKVKLTKTIRDIVDFDQKVDDKYYYTPKTFKRYDEIKDIIVNPESIYQWRRTYVRENKSNVCPTLTANMGEGGHNVPILLTKHGIRKLTPKEVFLFQGFPKDFQLPNLANSILYKQAGNSVVVPVIKRIGEKILIATSK